jgi:hypothetical protein
LADRDEVFGDFKKAGGYYCSTSPGRNQNRRDVACVPDVIENEKDAGTGTV